MDGKVAAVVASILMVTANAIKVNFTQEWIPNFGWDVTCFWDIPVGDSLQSVRLSNDGKQFMIYRPEKHGPTKIEVFRISEIVMTVNCLITEPGNHKGRCVLKMEPLQPPIHNILVKCEVSGERPTFKIAEEEHLVKILLPPSNASMVSKKQQQDSPARISLNCSSFGLPAPNLLWTIDDDKRAQADFSNRAWNATSKLWHVWAFLTFTPADHPSTVTCTPVASVDGETIEGIPAIFNTARRYRSATMLISAAFVVLQFLR